MVTMNKKFREILVRGVWAAALQRILLLWLGCSSFSMALASQALSCQSEPEQEIRLIVVGPEQNSKTPIDFRLDKLTRWHDTSVYDPLVKMLVNHQNFPPGVYDTDLKGYLFYPGKPPHIVILARRWLEEGWIPRGLSNEDLRDLEAFSQCWVFFLV